MLARGLVQDLVQGVLVVSPSDQGVTSVPPGGATLSCSLIGFRLDQLVSGRVTGQTWN